MTPRADATLRLYADKSRGKLPPKIDDLEMFQKLMPEEMKRVAAETKKTGIPDPEMLRMVQTLVRFMLATRELIALSRSLPRSMFAPAISTFFWMRP